MRCCRHVDVDVVLGNQPTQLIDATIERGRMERMHARLHLERKTSACESKKKAEMR